MVQQWLCSITLKVDKLCTQLRNNDPALTSVLLYNANLDQKLFVQLFDALQHNSVVTCLDLRRNVVSIAVAQALARAMDRKNCAIQSIMLDNTRLCPNALSLILDTLRHDCARLRRLSLSENPLADDGARVLADALRVDTRLTVRGCLIACARTLLTRFCSSQSVSMHAVGMTGVGLQNLADALARNITLQDLQLRNASGSDTELVPPLANLLRHCSLKSFNFLRDAKSGLSHSLLTEALNENITIAYTRGIDSKL